MGIFITSTLQDYCNSYLWQPKHYWMWQILANFDKHFWEITELRYSEFILCIKLIRLKTQYAIYQNNTLHWLHFFFVFPVVKVKCPPLPYTCITVKAFRNLTITSSLELTQQWKLDLPFIAQFTIVANSLARGQGCDEQELHTRRRSNVHVCLYVKTCKRTHAHTVPLWLKQRLQGQHCVMSSACPVWLVRV